MKKLVLILTTTLITLAVYAAGLYREIYLRDGTSGVLNTQALASTNTYGPALTSASSFTTVVRLKQHGAVVVGSEFPVWIDMSYTGTNNWLQTTNIIMTDSLVGNGIATNITVTASNNLGYIRVRVANTNAAASRNLTNIFIAIFSKE